MFFLHGYGQRSQSDRTFGLLFPKNAILVRRAQARRTVYPRIVVSDPLLI
jgi:hypothetical protein